MRLRLHTSAIALALAGMVLAACEAPEVIDKDVPYNPEYLGVDTRLLEGDLVNFIVSMRGARENADVAEYAKCAAAQYALIRGYGFARHVRTLIVEDNGVWHGDAAYVISATLPQGLKTIDAEVTVSECVENAIPRV